PIPEHIQLVQIDEDPWQIGKNYAVDVGVIGDTKLSLVELTNAISIFQTAEHRFDRDRRALALAQACVQAREQLQKKIESERQLHPMTPRCLMGALAKILPPNVVVIEEAVTTTNTTFERLGVLKNTTGYFGHRGWALGWGLGVAIGAKLAWPERPVLA